MSQSPLGVTRVLLVLESLAAEPELGVSELSGRFGWSKSATHRVLQALVETGYAEQMPETDKYRLTTKLFVVGSAVINRNGLTQVALPVMEELLHKTGETSNLAVRDGTDVIYVLKVDSDALLGATIRIGSRFPVHATALGKALLSALPDEALDALLGNIKLVRYTPNTITDAQQLRESITRIRETGYAVDREELSLAMRCVAAPIRDQSGGAVAAISIAAPVSRLTEDMLPELGELLHKAAAAISIKLGYTDPAGTGA